VQNLPMFDFLINLWQYREGMIYLSPAPLYHSAPQAAVNLTIRMGGTVIIMESFDPEKYLELIPKWGITHTQLVPTMFSRMLKLPDEVRKRYDLSSLEIAIHAAAPCPALVKDDIIKWWGPIIHEYYGATEGLGFTACNSEEWLAHRGTVGRVLLGDLHILDESMNPCPTGTPGTVWFKTATPFEYFNDPAKTSEARSADGSMSTVGDVGYVDDDGYLYLTDRATFMIISGGVNVYPQECENLLITHPKIADAAVFGVPNPDLGEEVKAVVQPMPGVAPGPDLAEELIAFCGQSLSRQKVPRSIDFAAELPRLPTGKLYKRLLRDRYWGNKTSRIVDVRMRMPERNRIDCRMRQYGATPQDAQQRLRGDQRPHFPANSWKNQPFVPPYGFFLVRIANACTDLAGCPAAPSWVSSAAIGHFDRTFQEGTPCGACKRLPPRLCYCCRLTTLHRQRSPGANQSRAASSGSITATARAAPRSMRARPTRSTSPLCRSSTTS
jgi:hypothetical protein